VALKAGVGRATIYRHWPTTLDLLVDTLRDMDQTIMQPGDEPFREWLRNQLTHAAAELALPTSRQFIALMIAEADNHTVIADLGAELIERTYRVMDEMIDQAVERGDLDRKLDRTDVVARTLGPLIYRTAMQRMEVTAGFIDDLVDSVAGC
jgi:AcrR family transcriptional regulator